MRSSLLIPALLAPLLVASSVTAQATRIWKRPTEALTVSWGNNFKDLVFPDYFARRDWSAECGDGNEVYWKFQVDNFAFASCTAPNGGTDFTKTVWARMIAHYNWPRLSASRR